MPEYGVGMPGRPSRGVIEGITLAEVLARLRAIDQVGRDANIGVGRLVNLVATYTTGDLVASVAEIDGINARRAQAGRPPISGGTPQPQPVIQLAIPQVVAAVLVPTTPQAPPPPRPVAAAVIPPMWLADP